MTKGGYYKALHSDHNYCIHYKIFKLHEELRAGNIQIKGRFGLLKETTMKSYGWMAPFELRNCLGNIPT